MYMSNQRPTIAFLSDLYLGDYQTTLHNAIESAADQLGMNLLCIIGRSVDAVPAYDRIHNKIYADITADSVSGIVFLGTSLSNYCGLSRISDFCKSFAPIPMCNIGLKIEGVPSILVNNRLFGAIPRHLAKTHECRKFAYIGGPPANEESQIRRVTFLETLDELCIPFNADLETAGMFTVQSGFEATVQLMEKKIPFDALVVANDEMAVGAMLVLKNNGIEVGRDVHLMSFDDIPSARFTSPKLSTMRTPLEGIGRQAVELLQRQICGDEVAKLQELDPVLVCRETCGCGGFGGGGESGSATKSRPPKAVSVNDGGDERAALQSLLAQQIHIPAALCPDWEAHLVDAVFEELRSGKKGIFVRALTDILDTADRQLWITDELQNAVTLLRGRLQHTPYNSTALDNLWDLARKKLFDTAAHRQMERLTAVTAANRLFLNRSRGALPPALTREALEDAVTMELMTIGIDNGMVSAYTSADEGELECLAAFSDGRPVNVAELSVYPSTTFIPKALFRESRTSHVVLVLTSGAERLGVLVLQFGGPEFYYEMCREHMSAFLKNIAFHREQVKQLQEETEQTRRELEVQHRHKLESLGILAGGIAHDFNNMLSAILGNLDSAIIDIEASTPSVEPILECKSVVRHAAGLCRQLLAYSGKGKFIVQRVNVNVVVRDLKDLLKMAVPRNVSLVYELKEGLPDIEGDVNQLNQVLINLVINGAEAMGDRGGIITLTSTLLECNKADFVDVLSDGALTPGMYVVAVVDDTGSGMDKSVVARIFDPFFTTKFTGRGLGLAAVLGIVRSHRGGIRVTSKPGSGTCFEIFFPTLAKASEVPQRFSKAPVWKGHGTILVVDDEPSVLRASERLLKRMGFSVITAHDGQHALNIFQDLFDTVDCVLLDISMPGMGGLTVMKELRRIHPSIPIILTSGYSEEQAGNLHDQTAPSAFIQKPYDSARLGGTIRQVMGRTDA
jgi:DNA-binding LacI/PurR family transcriptional regulator/signal transduction histidine kinase